MSRAGTISAHGVGKVFEGAGGRRVALEGIDLEVTSGEFVALLGPSGCGKSTLLSVLGGFTPPTSGEVLIDGEPVTGPDPRFVTMFQDHALFPWRSVLGNVEFGLEAAGVGRGERRERALKWLGVVGLEDAAAAHVCELSGGMRQRVNLARALAVQPEVLFMDEPLGALDFITRMRVQEELLAVRAATDATMVLVTHDVEEALFLADRILLMTPCPGRIAEEVAVGGSHPKDRTSPAFSAMRADLLRRLELVHAAETDYEI